MKNLHLQLKESDRLIVLAIDCIQGLFVSKIERVSLALICYG